MPEKVPGLLCAGDEDFLRGLLREAMRADNQ